MRFKIMLPVGCRLKQHFKNLQNEICEIGIKNVTFGERKVVLLETPSVFTNAYSFDEFFVMDIETNDSVFIEKVIYKKKFHHGYCINADKKLNISIDEYGEHWENAIFEEYIERINDSFELVM